jgi:hypothetical protein
MKRNLFFSIISAAAVVLAVGFTNCSREGSNEDNEPSSVFLKVLLDETRAVADSVLNQSNPTFTTGWVMLTNSNGIVLFADEIGGGGTTVAALENGKTYTNVPAGVQNAHIFGNVGTISSWPASPVGKNITNYRDIAVTVAQVSKADGTVANVPLYGTDAIVPDGSNYKSDVTVSPIAGRVEINRIVMQTTEKTGVTSFKVKNIFVNYFYPTRGFDGNGTSAIKDGGQTKINYAAGTAPYTVAGELYDAVDVTSADNSPIVNRNGVKPASKQVWAYNLLQPAEPPTGTTIYFPHIIVEISNIDVVATSGDVYNTYENGNPTFWLTITGVTDGTSPLNFTKGNVYKINEILFTLGDLSDIPEPSDKSVKVTASVVKWKVREVTPIL